MTTKNENVENQNSNEQKKNSEKKETSENKGPIEGDKNPEGEKKTKPELLQELVELGFITEKQFDLYDNLTIAGLEDLIGKLKSNLQSVSSILEEKNSLIDELKSQGSGTDDIVERRLQKQADSSILQFLESLAGQITQKANEFKSQKKS